MKEAPTYTVVTVKTLVIDLGKPIHSDWGKMEEKRKRKKETEEEEIANPLSNNAKTFLTRKREGKIVLLESLMKGFVGREEIRR